jgi:hypothetical protein
MTPEEELLATAIEYHLRRIADRFAWLNELDNQPERARAEEEPKATHNEKSGLTYYDVMRKFNIPC